MTCLSSDIRIAGIRLYGLLVLLLVYLVGLTSPLCAQWSNDPTANTPISTPQLSDQSWPVMTSDGSGGSIIVWQDSRNGDADIFAQKINSAGMVQWTLDGIEVCTASGVQGMPSVVSDGTGGAIVVWQDYRMGAYADIYAQRIDASGTARWTVDGVQICAADHDQLSPKIITDGYGGAIITWEDYRSDTNWKVYAQRINAAGAVQWSQDGVAVSTGSGDQILPQISTDCTGGAIIAWDDLRSGVYQDVYAQRINSLGVVQWAAGGAAVSTANEDQAAIQIVSDGTGGAIIAWQDLRSLLSVDIYAQRINVSGAAQWTVDGVPVCANAKDQITPVLVGDGSGGAIIAWQDYRNGPTSDIYAQRIYSSGTVAWAADGAPICTETDNQVSPVIVSDDDSGAIIVWMDYRSSSNYDLYGQRVSSSGTVQWATLGSAISTAPGDQAIPVIVSDALGGAIVAWQDLRSGYSNDIYAQQVDRFGNLYPSPSLAAVGDVANDQGGKLRVLWKASHFDSWPDTTVCSYTLWMGVKSTGLMGKSSQAHPKALPTKVAGDDVYWQEEGTVAAKWRAGYDLLITTASDSGPQGIPWYYFQVVANSYDRKSFWVSNIDSGYSVDNIAPDPPGGLSGSVVSGNVDLKWKRNTEADLWKYEIYRSSSPLAALDESECLSECTDTNFVDHSPLSGGMSYYVVCAEDVHGNPSAESNQISFTPGDFSLAATLTSFTAEALDFGVSLKWKTGAEVDNAGFIVLRQSGNENSFKEISNYKTNNSLKGLGTSAQGRSYSYTDESVSATGKYLYQLECVTTYGKVSKYTEITVDVSTPTDFALFQNYPNPFNPSTTIAFNLKEQSEVTLTIYNVLGEDVATYRYGIMEAGRYQEEINLERLTSGVYYHRLDAVGKDGKKFTSTKKLVLMK